MRDTPERRGRKEQYVTKIYKAIKANELEHFTRDGWQREGEPLKQQELIEHEDTRGREPTNEERQNGCYSRIYEPTKAFFGDVLIFVVWKDQDQIAREQDAEMRARNAEHELGQLTTAATKHAQAIEALTSARDVALKSATEYREQVWARDDKNRKLEGDLAKIRNAIGEMQMNVILGIKKA